MGLIVILPRTHFNLVPVGLDYAVSCAERTASIQQIQFCCWLALPRVHGTLSLSMCIIQSGDSMAREDVQTLLGRRGLRAEAENQVIATKITHHHRNLF